MQHLHQFYIDGQWVDPVGQGHIDVINPATEEAIATIAAGGSADVDRAVAAARQAFTTYAQTTREQRLDLLARIIDIYRRRTDDLAEAISVEMGAPLAFARDRHVPAGLGHLQRAAEVLKTYSFDETINSVVVTREPIGVVGLITPWNWPLNQIACKVGPALAAGCTMVLKPSEIAPLSGIIFAEILHEAGVPAGVFNLIHGDGPNVGQAISSHPDIDMVSFTGSTRAGILVAKAAADTVKRVHQELGGKSPNILLDDADFEADVTHGARACFANSGQSCNAPTRMLVPLDRQQQAAEVARRIAEETIVGDPQSSATTIGPVVSRVQFDRIQSLIEAGIKEGATLVAGGPGRPAGLNRGYLCAADRVFECPERHEHRQGGDLRPCSVDPPLQGRGGCHSDRQRHGLWPVELCDIGRHRAGTTDCPAHPCGHGSHQWFTWRHSRSLWRLQAIRQWP